VPVAVDLQHGFEVGRYISLERLVEESRVEYYEVLRASLRDGTRGGTTSSPGSTIS